MLECMREDLCNTKVTQLNDAALGQEYVLAFQVTMQDFAVMDMFETETDLSEPGQHLVLRKIPATLFLDPTL